MKYFVHDKGLFEFYSENYDQQLNSYVLVDSSTILQSTTLSIVKFPHDGSLSFFTKMDKDASQ